MKELRLIKITLPRILISRMLRELTALVRKNGMVTLLHPLPDDVKIFDICYDHNRRQLELYLESDQYEPLPEGAEPRHPYFTVTRLSDYAEEWKIDEN